MMSDSLKGVVDEPPLPVSDVVVVVLVVEDSRGRRTWAAPLDGIVMDENVKVDVRVSTKDAFEMTKFVVTEAFMVLSVSLVLGDEDVTVDGPFLATNPRMVVLDKETHACSLGLDLIKMRTSEDT